ncbi:MAG: TOBE domain-containing protein, partial [Thermostichales cyanobacterium DRC_bins_46]
RVPVSIRPESIQLNHRNGHVNSLQATVEDIYFLGSIVRVRARLARQHMNVDTFNKPGLVLPSPGESVTLNFDATAARVLQRKSDAG